MDGLSCLDICGYFDSLVCCRPGKPIKVVTVGGSITAGQGAIDAPNWPQYVLNYMQDNYGDKAVQGRIQCVKLSRVLIILVSDSETLRLPSLSSGLQLSTVPWGARSAATCQRVTTSTFPRMRISSLWSTGERASLWCESMCAPLSIIRIPTQCERPRICSTSLPEQRPQRL